LTDRQPGAFPATALTRRSAGCMLPRLGFEGIHPRLSNRRSFHADQVSEGAITTHDARRPQGILQGKPERLDGHYAPFLEFDLASITHLGIGVVDHNHIPRLHVNRVVHNAKSKNSSIWIGFDNFANGENPDIIKTPIT
jgi:hypothetical protein